MSKSYFIKAFGCKVSQSDAAAVHQFLQANGYKVSNSTEEANIIFLQTCTVTQNSDSEARQFIRKVKKINPDAKIIVVGCYAQRAPEEIYELGVNSVIGNLGIDKWKKLKEILNIPYDEFELIDSSFYPSLKTLNRMRPYLKIYDGCNHRCSYCIVPFVRGKGRSLHPDLAIEQLKKLIELGYKEILITGVNLASYGEDLGIKSGLLLLAERIEKLDGNFRIRFSSVEPSIQMLEFFKFVCEAKKIVPHFHLPLQHMSEKILKDMRRPYRKEEFLEIVYLISQKSSKACIGTDIIVGFPTEDEKEFQECYDGLKKIPVHYFHVFKYSPRPGTEAFSLKPKSPERIVKERSNFLIELSKSKFFDFKKSLIGEDFQILTYSAVDKNIVVGLTENYIHLKIRNENKEISENIFINGKLSYQNNEFYALI